MGHRGLNFPHKPRRRLRTPRRSDTKNGKISRRRFLLLAAATGGMTILGFPHVWAKTPFTLHYLASGVSAHQEIANQASKDLGFSITMERAATMHENIMRTITRPKTVDLVELDYGHIDALIRMNMLHAIDARRIETFDSMSTIFTKGTLGGKTLSTQGGAPFTHMYLDNPEAKTFAKGPTRWLTLVPTMYNADTLGIRPDLINRRISKWSELLNPEFTGQTALINSAGVGILDAAMACESAGLVRYKDKGNMSRQEIDSTIDVLIKAKKRGQFHSFWNDFTESVRLMASGDVVIQSMWSPAVTRVRQMGIPCVYQPLAEGYRGWCYGIGMSRALPTDKISAAYDFLNWFLSGWSGGFLARQGYYPSVPETARNFMKPYEWDYWMGGKPAEQDILSPQQIVIETKGTVRDGGTFTQRMGNIACWNSLMTESRYLLKKWQQLEEA